MARRSLLYKKTRERFKQIVVFFMMFLLAFSGMLPSGLPLLKVKAEDNTNTAGTCSQQQKQVVLINGDFETPTAGEPVSFFDAKDVPGWNSTDVFGQIEIWRDQNPASGHQHAELNASSVGMLYQDVETIPGQTLHWRLAHKGRLGTDTMRLRIGAVTANPLETPEVQQMTDGNETWGHYEGTYIVPPEQTVTRFGFESVSAAGGDIGIGNFLDDIFLGSGPCVSATKSVDKDGSVYLGDELTYKVNVKNYGGDIASDSVFIDTIPDGTEYVPGSIKVTKNGTTTGITDAIDGDEGDFQNNRVTVKLGKLPYIKDTPEGFTVQFKVKVKLSNIGKKITNKAQIQYQDLLVKQQKQTETNEVVNDIAPRDSKLESKKTAKNLQNKNTEVGDEIEYTIKTRNTVSDSLVKYLVITDTLPEGLEYVPGTLQVDGKDVTDAEDTDNGQYVNGTVNGKLGDVTDTEWHTVVFHAKIKSGQSGKTITNTAEVTGEGVPPQNPKTDVPVDPKDSKLESEKTAKNLQNKKNEVGDEIEYTIKTRNTISDSLVKNLVIGDTLPEGLEYVPGTLKVDGHTVTDVVDTDNGQFDAGKVTGKLGDVTDTEWHTVVFHAKIKSGQSGKTITNTAEVTGEGVPPQNPKTDVPVDPKSPTLESEKTVKNLQNKNTEVGDEIEYTIKTRNTVSDSLVKNLVITDTLPEGLEYVPGTLQVDGKAATDAEDTDNGQFVNGAVSGKLRDVMDTEWHTVVFHAKVKAGQAGKVIQNKAKVTGENVTPQEPQAKVEVSPRDSKLESEKTAKNLQNKNTEVGDEIEYTIKTRNTVFDSLVENLVIADTLPEGLEYVPGTLQVDGKVVTDAADTDNGQYVNGTVTGKLGDVTDTEWHTVVFHAKIKSGQFGKTITNTAEVTGEGISIQTPKTDVSVDPEKPADKPAIDPIKDTDKEITGTGTPGDEIIVKSPTGKEIGKTTVDKDGEWKLDVPEATKLTKGDEITAVAKKPGSEKESEPAKTVVTSEEKTVDPTKPIDPMKLLPSTGGQFSIALYAGGLLFVIGLLFLARSKRKYN
ncbi:isopeptide-forming domain-containing fimbrial protein [Bacillus sp. 166amftsu]|uniref:isopeptide-forming domain-containing fimbrial protein n=1 Tax=Bacillus sp. 166amftsu TaxID=1761753 RepID=UPI00089B25C3|nr:isopeptide-forming domain-containing fimbrial protein [Bacillus sp. 166amftsu]SDZ13039.1 LPXTG-motif cell wall anchor domain-containing protein/conserved repeat domain-containing protein/fimbrial isopeptide formation D2 domain-containing protein [Bacillus sp. 166amftsu]